MRPPLLNSSQQEKTQANPIQQQDAVARTQGVETHPIEVSQQPTAANPRIPYYAPPVGYIKFQNNALRQNQTIAPGIEMVRASTPLIKQVEATAPEKAKKPSPIINLLRAALPPILAFAIPFAIYYTLALYGIDISHIMYFIVMLSLLGTAYLIGVEALVALRIDNPPLEPVMAYPPASAIIAAYLPNEAATIVETVNVILNTIHYPAPFQLILAYNTPRDMPVEYELQAIAQRDSRLHLLRVQNSTSKAQNVNRALDDVTGDFVGVFDADHHPAPNSFTRAWRWLTQGYDVVQGHCVIRNGESSWVARLVAVDFEVIYALGHPGRTRMHGFGVFGGSNGYWRTGLLRQTGMRHSMLTEDIDSSLRVVQQGYKIAYDPMIISRELAPETLGALWNQRMRWAQGWFQVSLKHFIPALRSPYLSIKQKLGMIHLLFWRELYMWLSIQIIPILTFQALHGTIEWFYPPFLFSSFITLCVGPVQILLAYIAAAPDIKQHRSWFISYGLYSLLFFTAWKNHISRVAHLKEAFGEREWKVTPRTSAPQAKGN
ncbi:glycosyltransferase [Tengunoibacter tsumagoiensis]|uniref:Glycosyl transferase n=1 Tax=Tengunoibacter tsumagoiensis TaxID=2014871 RepID=A0A402A5T7_9CHLR|nr:glycosyltransferase [Tengunoibacter tsumagoiensis]GCE14498.1 hypothetical protein KTT_43570 [Tengunoibacter tsumagoiensis]